MLRHALDVVACPGASSSGIPLVDELQMAATGGPISNGYDAYPLDAHQRDGSDHLLLDDAQGSRRITGALPRARHSLQTGRPRLCIPWSTVARAVRQNNLAGDTVELETSEPAMRISLPLKDVQDARRYLPGFPAD